MVRHAILGYNTDYASNEMFVKVASPGSIVNECTPFFDVEILERVLQQTHVCSTTVFGPTDMGVPCNRVRRYTVLIRKDVSSNLGLFSQDTFRQLITAPIATDANVFLRASPRQIQAFMNDMAEQ